MFSFHFPLDDITSRIRAAQGKLQEDRRNILTILGTQLLSMSQLAYREKARGGRGSDGITWAKLKRSTLKARVMQRAEGKRIVAQRKSLAQQIRSLIGTRNQRRTARPTAAGRRAARRRAAAAQRRTASPVRRLQRKLRTMPKGRSGRGASVKDQVAKLRRKRLELLIKLEQLVDREASSYEIGVNTGLQRASASPGFNAPDGKGGNLFDVQPLSVTVGYHRNYSTFFDEHRTLLPDPLPNEWTRKLEATVQGWAERVVGDVFG